MNSNLKSMTIEIPVSIPDKEKMMEFEEYLNRNLFPFKKRGKGVFYYSVTIEDPINAFWIGCNLISIQYGLLKS